MRLVRSFKCICCLKTFSSQLQLKRHQQLHTGMNYFGFDHKNGIELSKLFTLPNVRGNLYSRDKQLKCFLCCKQLRSSGDKNNHLKTHCRVKLKPKENVENILQENNLSQNLQMQSSLNIKNGFSCDKCLKTFSLKGR